MKKSDVVETWIILGIGLSVFGFFKWVNWSIMNEGFWYYYGKPFGQGLMVLGFLIYFMYALLKTYQYMRAKKKERV